MFLGSLPSIGGTLKSTGPHLRRGGPGARGGGRPGEALAPSGELDTVPTGQGSAAQESRQAGRQASTSGRLS